MKVPYSFDAPAATVLSLHRTPLLVGLHEYEYVNESSTVLNAYRPGMRAVMGAVLSEQARTSTLPIEPRNTSMVLLKRQIISQLLRQSVELVARRIRQRRQVIMRSAA